MELYVIFFCIFQVHKLRFLVEVSISNSKLTEQRYREVGYSRPEKHYEPIQHN